MLKRGPPAASKLVGAGLCCIAHYVWRAYSKRSKHLPRETEPRAAIQTARPRLLRLESRAQSVASSDERDEFASIRLLETEVSRLKKIVILLS